MNNDDIKNRLQDSMSGGWPIILDHSYTTGVLANKIRNKTLVPYAAQRTVDRDAVTVAVSKAIMGLPFVGLVLLEHPEDRNVQVALTDFREIAALTTFLSNEIPLGYGEGDIAPNRWFKDLPERLQHFIEDTIVQGICISLHDSYFKNASGVFMRRFKKEYGISLPLPSVDELLGGQS